MFYAINRQKFLVAQGYAFETIKELPFMQNEEEMKSLVFSHPNLQSNILADIVAKKTTDMFEVEKDIEKDEDLKDLINEKKK